MNEQEHSAFVTTSGSISASEEVFYSSQLNTGVSWINTYTSTNASIGITTSNDNNTFKWMWEDLPIKQTTPPVMEKPYNFFTKLTLTK